jgi:hypothetical protein
MRVAFDVLEDAFYKALVKVGLSDVRARLCAQLFTEIHMGSIVFRV